MDALVQRGLGVDQLISSPYRRALETAQIALEAGLAPKAPKLSAEEKRPRGRPRLTSEEKAARAAARALLKLQEGPKAMAPRKELAPWTKEEIMPDGLVC